MPNITPQEHFAATFRTEIYQLEDRIEAERDSLSAWRKCEAPHLALSPDELARLQTLRVLAAAPGMLSALRVVLDRATMPGFLRDQVKAAIAEAEGR